MSVQLVILLESLGLPPFFVAKVTCGILFVDRSATTDSDQTRKAAA